MRTFTLPPYEPDLLIAYRFPEGLSVELIASDRFPALTPEQVYGAVAYCLGRRAEAGACPREADDDYENFRERSS